MATVLAVLLIPVLLLIAYLISQRKPKGFPPGPWGYPILGHFPLLGLEPYKTAIRWKPKYGPIVGVDFASFPCVIISDYKLGREAYANPAFELRPNYKHSYERCGGGGHIEGIAFANGRTWREQRTFTLRRLRELGGFGTKSMESIIVEQVYEFMGILQNRTEVQNGRPILTRGLFNVAIINSLWGILAGKPFDQTDPEARRAAYIVVEGAADASLVSMLAMFIPWFADYFPDWITRKSNLDKLYQPLVAFLQPYVDEHWRTHLVGQPRDFMDAYIDEIKATTDPESSFHISRSQHSLVTTILDLFLAGSETAALTLNWITLFLARFPEIQDRLATEVMDVVGEDQSPSLHDRKSMPYTEAVIHEVWRMRPPLPLNLAHSTKEATEFHGFTIPKDTMVFVNIHDAHFDQDIWGDPENFRPERWLSEDGSELMTHKAFMPFSIGRRVCPGEQLGRDQVFLFTVGLFQKFHVEASGPVPTLEPKLGGTTLGPKPHKILFRLRKGMP